ncbi:hypothetical protein SCHPADRAFT_885630 [Schizopora paradoxa]|uniref:GATA-domain-containing protein n=1 Tax=Schizopora paradoxa TaxID=27342 RepID=A0A0H2S5J5_9AGAM|nr:hypothetical protein SCHPADRAFT_885630 [Schizopora paradoxa]
MASAETYDEAKVGKQKQGAVFEFTRRKRWSDILISEAPDLAIFILSKAGTIWYTGPAVADLLGWKVGELIDKDVSLILNDDDLIDFHDDLERCASTDTTLISYARLKCRPPADGLAHAVQKELLYELRGNFVSDLRTNEKMFFILTAKPYPSKNMAIINTILELKIEHETLSQRLAELRLIKEQRHPGSSSTSKSSQTRNSYMQLPKPQHSSSGFRHYNMDGDGPSGSDAVQGAEEDEDALRKKKRPFAADHQFVCYTCGRVDSPEWRKGPTGPKTLCNACGLRWAKRTKKTEKAKPSYQEDSPSAHTSRPPGARKSVSAINPPAPHPALRCTPPSMLVTTSMPSATTLHSPSPLSASSLATFVESPSISQTLAPQEFLLPPPGLHAPPGHAPYSTLQHALAPESEPSSHLQAHNYPHLPPWSSTQTRNAYGY